MNTENHYASRPSQMQAHVNRFAKATTKAPTNVFANKTNSISSLFNQQHGRASMVTQPSKRPFFGGAAF